MDDREADAARRVIRSRWVTQGPEVAAFEREFAATVGAPHACAVSSCTTALHLALRAVGVGPGDEVVTASFSYVATANAIRYCGAVPVFADIEAHGPNLDPEHVERSLGPATRAILCVHQMGVPCDVYRLAAIATRHGIPLVEDAACAIGSEIRDPDGAFAPIGRPIGDVACFSFHPRKLLTTGDGGMLTTGHADLDARFRRERQHGMSVPDWARHGAARVVAEHHVSLGFNYRMTDIQAAVGRVQLSRLPELVARRRLLADRYRRVLRALPVVVPDVPDRARSNWQTFWIELPDRIDRDTLMQSMLDHGVATRRGIMCAHREPVYANEPWRAGAGGLSRSERRQERSLMLPLFHEMTEADQDQVVDALTAALGSGALQADG
jgi:dTDP-4-amino-4,6-dideoxygalactose transaminase